jgi:hypothetical protein
MASDLPDLLIAVGLIGLAVAAFLVSPALGLAALSAVAVIVGLVLEFGKGSS